MWIYVDRTFYNEDIDAPSGCPSASGEHFVYVWSSCFWARSDIRNRRTKNSSLRHKFVVYAVSKPLDFYSVSNNCSIGRDHRRRYALNGQDRLLQKIYRALINITEKTKQKKKIIIITYIWKLKKKKKKTFN